ncbi:hypothetical protein PQR67_26830 [Paraburkholderia fungorum]|uniref:hypothetical protein n=1 Tax=Paraburkholderia fungorum TaxID=134537 RepID=UPI0038BCE1C3
MRLGMAFRVDSGHVCREADALIRTLYRERKENIEIASQLIKYRLRARVLNFYFQFTNAGHPSTCAGAKNARDADKFALGMFLIESAKSMFKSDA